MKKFLGKIGGAFKKVFTGIGNFFKHRYAGLKTLVMMQLKDKLNFSFKADKKGTLTKLILYVVMFAAVTAVIAVVFYLANLLLIFGTDKTVPLPIFNLFFIAMLLLSIISCIAKLTDSLYFSKDNLVLLSYPVRPNIVFLSKLIVFYIIEIIKNILYMIPMFLAYGIIHGFQWYYFPWVIFSFFIVAAIPVAIASIVSIPYMYFKMLLRKNPFLQDILLLIVLITATVFAFILINMIPANLHFISKWSTVYYPEFLKFAMAFEKWFLPLQYVAMLITGAKRGAYSPSLIVSPFNSHTWIILLGTIGALAFLILLSYLIAKPLFFKIAAKPFEYNKKIIFHNFSETKSKFKSAYGNAFVPVFDGALKKKQLVELRIKFEKALNEIVKQGNIFPKGKISDKRILKLLERYTGYKFMIVSLDELLENGHIGFFVEYRNNIPFLVLAKKIGMSYVDCYDPNYLSKQNYRKTAFLSALWKDFLVDTRTPGRIAGNYILFIITPLAIALLNKLFSSINTNFLGVSLTIVFNILIMTLIPLSSNVMFASIYSREGESAYLLKAAPINYMRTLTTKLVVRAVLMVISILVTCILYRYYATPETMMYIRPSWLFIGVACLYLAHMIWSAELDFMNPQDRLYSETGEGNISNPNETTSTILVYVLTVAFVGISFFFINEGTITAFYKIAAVGALTLLARILLFSLRIKGYKTSRGERGRN